MTKINIVNFFRRLQIMREMNVRVPIKKMLTFGLLPSFLKKTIYRLQGNTIGRHVKFSLGSVILSRERFIIGDDTTIGFFTSVVGKTIKIGKRCNIRSAVLINANSICLGNDVIISETAIIRAGHLSQKSELIIDDLVHIFPHTTIDPSCRIHLGEECAVGPGCSIFTHGSYKNILDGYNVAYGDVTVGCRVELTYNVFVAPGVCIGDDTIIAYGSFVNKDLPAKVLAAGMPAVVKRTKSQFAPEPSEKEKEAIIDEIIKDFINYLDYLGFEKPQPSIQRIGIQEIVFGDHDRFNLLERTCDQPSSKLSKEF